MPRRKRPQRRIAEETLEKARVALQAGAQSIGDLSRILGCKPPHAWACKEALGATERGKRTKEKGAPGRKEVLWGLP